MRTSFLGHVCSIAFLWKCALSTIKQEAKKSSLYFWRCLRSGCSHMTKFSSVIRLVGIQATGISFLQSSNTNNKNNGYFETLVPNVVMTLLQWFHCVYTLVANLFAMMFVYLEWKTNLWCHFFHVIWRRHLDVSKSISSHCQSYYGSSVKLSFIIYFHNKQYPSAEQNHFAYPVISSSFLDTNFACVFYKFV